MQDSFKTLANWIDIPSVTGAEGDYGDCLAGFLEQQGFSVERQELSPGRFNLLARAGEPRLVFCTHLDTVPPFFGPTLERGLIRGRGSCDAKGQALAMIQAARALIDSGEDRIGFLFTVGEEVDSVGAILADAKLADPWRPEFTIVGEPTDNTFVRGHKGVLKCVLEGHGVAGHSSQPVGPSAVHELVAVLSKLMLEKWGEHELFGSTTLNIGTIAGGLAENVVAPEAKAELMFRLVEDPQGVLARVREACGEHVEMSYGKGYSPVEFEVPEGKDSKIVAFATDAPFLRSWGKPLLYGPGSILDAHTSHEMLELNSFEQAVAEHESTARELLARIPR